MNFRKLYSMQLFSGLLMLLLLNTGCKKTSTDTTTVEKIIAADISSYPQIMETQPVFLDLNGQQKPMPVILKENGINTIRLRLWVNPASNHSSFEEVKNFSAQLKNQGFKIWLTLHYSDTWADPGHQATPQAWQSADFVTLKDSVYAYTKKVVQQIKPDYIQIGNEINNGLLFPQGSKAQLQQMIQLLNAGALAVREISANTKIILHYAGHMGASEFYSQVASVDYDMIGISYYPLWHGKDLQLLKNRLIELSNTYNKEVVIAETAYPFTLGWNDMTHNVVGSDDALILPDFPATPLGQKMFIRNIKTISTSFPKAKGFCYWGAELIAWKGSQATDGSSWENQSLFGFDNKALPILEEF